MPMLGRITSVKPTYYVTRAGEQIRRGGYLFVVGEDGVPRMVHRTEFPDVALTAALVGCFVEFEPVLTGTGPRAIRVQLLPNTPARDLTVGVSAGADPAVGMAVAPER